MYVQHNRRWVAAPRNKNPFPLRQQAYPFLNLYFDLILAVSTQAIYSMSLYLILMLHSSLPSTEMMRLETQLGRLTVFKIFTPTLSNVKHPLRIGRIKKKCSTRGSSVYNFDATRLPDRYFLSHFIIPSLRRSDNNVQRYEQVQPK